MLNVLQVYLRKIVKIIKLSSNYAVCSALNASSTIFFGVISIESPRNSIVLENIYVVDFFSQIYLEYT